MLSEIRPEVKKLTKEKIFKFVSFVNYNMTETKLQFIKRGSYYYKSITDSNSYRATSMLNKAFNTTTLYNNYLSADMLFIEYDGRMYKKTKNWYTGA